MLSVSFCFSHRLPRRLSFPEFFVWSILILSRFLASLPAPNSSLSFPLSHFRFSLSFIFFSFWTLLDLDRIGSDWIKGRIGKTWSINKKNAFMQILFTSLLIWLPPHPAFNFFFPILFVLPFHCYGVAPLLSPSPYPTSRWFGLAYVARGPHHHYHHYIIHFFCTLTCFRSSLTVGSFLSRFLPVFSFLSFLLLFWFYIYLWHHIAYRNLVQFAFYILGSEFGLNRIGFFRRKKE